MKEREVYGGHCCVLQISKYACVISKLLTGQVQILVLCLRLLALHIEKKVRGQAHIRHAQEECGFK